MASSVLRRFYRARPLPSLIICLPGVLLVVWYCWSAYAELDRYRRAAGAKLTFTLETFHIAVHDRMDADLRRTVMPAPPDPSQLDTYVLRVGRQDWKTLTDSAGRRRERPYVDAKIEKGGRLLDAEVRLRGGRHWHTSAAQKSLKVKLDKGELLDGHRVFNLINDPTPLVVGEQLELELAGELGVLAPVSRFVRLRINAKDFGVYHYEAAADEGLLRGARRMPGSVYTSELPRSEPASALWSKTQHWTKVASRTDSPEDEADVRDLERFLERLSHATPLEFADFAEHELDLDAFARLDALDVAFGEDQRDFRENHNYYFDPYRGRWEPVVTQFRGFSDDPLYRLVDNPISLRLEMTPGYATRRDRALYEFLTSAGAPASVHARATRLLQKLGPELQSDPYWDAYRMLPRVDAFHRRMLRPNTLRRLALVVESELVTYGHRHAQLMAELEENPLYVRVGAAVASSAGTSPDGARDVRTASGEGFSTPVDVIISGRAGVGLAELSVKYAPECSARGVQLLARGRPLAVRETSGHVVLEAELPLYPSVQLLARPDTSDRRGHVRSELAPVAYPLELRSSCAPQQVVARGRHLATDARVVSRPAAAELIGRMPSSRLGGDDTPRLEAGEVAPHPWDIERREPKLIEIGPGDVTIAATRVFERDEAVEVRAGTRLLMSPGASLIFLGPARFAGTRHAPIAVLPAADGAWGGIALQGPGTRGSRLAHVHMSGGSTPAWRSVSYPAMLDIHHTSDVHLEGCTLTRNAQKSEALHVAYVDGFTMLDTELSDIPGDALDLEYVEAKLRRLRAMGVGDDALDLMSSRVHISDSVILGAAGNGISSGEESRVDVQNTLIAGSAVGVLAKNAARVSLTGSVLYENGVGVRTYQRTVRYAGPSEVLGNLLFVAGSEKQAIDRDDREDERLDAGRVFFDLPQRGMLDHVLENVLELAEWSELDRWVQERRERGVR